VQQGMRHSKGSVWNGALRMLRRAVLCAVVFGPALCCHAAHTVTDEAGRVVVVPDHPHRIISLVPSVTDDVFALGAGADVVAITDYVEFPHEAKLKPSVGSIMDPSMETILSLHPDLVLGMPRANNQATLDRLVVLGIPVYLVDPHGVAGIVRSVGDVGQAIGREADAHALVARLTQRIDAVRASVKGKPVVTVFLPVSYDPVITIGRGSFFTEMIAIAGGHSITDDIGQEWPQVSLETVIARAPKALLLLRGGNISLASLKQRPGWSTLPAVRDGRVYFYDKRMDFSSPVAIDALEDLARQFHP
jgi:iron complex transport system substrate-binding protein